MSPRSLLGLLAFLAGTALLAAPAAPTGPHDPADMSRGAAPHRATLAGLTLTTKSGEHLAVALPAAHADDLTLLGNSPRGFLVVDHQGARATKIWAVPASGQKRLVLSPYDPPTASIVLSHDGRRLMTLEQRSGRTAVFDLRGHRLDRFVLDTGEGRILDFSGPEAVVADQVLYHWRIGSSPVRVESSLPVAASLAHDVLFVGAEVSGPTSLSDPGTPAWTKRWDPIAVSPNGAFVVGTGPQSLVEVRRMSDGSLLSAIGLTTPGRFVAWEDATHYLAVATGRAGSAAVRCDALSGQSRRTTPLTTQHLTMSLG